MTLSTPADNRRTPLDLVLFNLAMENGLEAIGLESIEEQLAIFESLPVDDQVALLLDAVCHYGQLQSQIELMVELYLARDLDAMLALSLQNQTELDEQFQIELLDKRNHRMVERLHDEFAAGGVFAAVGALHLPGPKGLLAEFRGLGFTVQALY